MIFSEHGICVLDSRILRKIKDNDIQCLRSRAPPPSQQQQQFSNSYTQDWPRVQENHNFNINRSYNNSNSNNFTNYSNNNSFDSYSNSKSSYNSNSFSSYTTPREFRLVGTFKMFHINRRVFRI